MGVSGTTICALCVCEEGVALIWGGFVCVLLGIGTVSVLLYIYDFFIVITFSFIYFYYYLFRIFFGGEGM